MFYQITGVIVLAGIVAMLVSYLKQPSIIAFILTGLVIGSFGYGQIHNSGTLDALRITLRLSTRLGLLSRKGYEGPEEAERPRLHLPV